PAPADGKAAILARIMRSVTNHLFLRMSRIWSGRQKEPDDAPQKYARLNALLVDWFETILAALEAGEYFTEEKVARYLKEAEQSIIDALHAHPER
ncbi:MAG TPA: B12-binding domain-containing radical SAM protein, partial [Firmicutes bacterium]|nr:B12-binding domain-containing radical SAM protein [Bacillota bacterium]